jgi:hypothetical protein
MLVRETAGALASFSYDPHGLVTACRRMIARHPESGPLLWLAARVLTAPEPIEELYDCMDSLDDDATAVELRHAIPDGASVAVLGWPDLVADALVRRGDVQPFVVDALGEGSGLVQRLWNNDIDAIDVPVAGLAAAVAQVDLVLLESVAVGDTECLAVSGSRAAAAVARHLGSPVWVVGGVGRMLPAKLYSSLVSRAIPDMPWDRDEEQVPLDLITHVVGPGGLQPTAEALQGVDCPVAAELLRDAI